jgi:hypothetical protein
MSHRSTSTTSSWTPVYTPRSPDYRPSTPAYRPSTQANGSASPTSSPTRPPSSPTRPPYSPTSPVYSPTSPGSPAYSPSTPVYSTISPKYSPTCVAYSPTSPAYSSDSPSDTEIPHFDLNTINAADVTSNVPANTPNSTESLNFKLPATGGRTSTHVHGLSHLGLNNMNPDIETEGGPLSPRPTTATRARPNVSHHLSNVLWDSTVAAPTSTPNPEPSAPTPGVLDANSMSGPAYMDNLTRAISAIDIRNTRASLKTFPRRLKMAPRSQIQIRCRTGLRLRGCKAC